MFPMRIHFKTKTPSNKQLNKITSISFKNLTSVINAFVTTYIE